MAAIRLKPSGQTLVLHSGRLLVKVKPIGFLHVPSLPEPFHHVTLTGRSLLIVEYRVQITGYGSLTIARSLNPFLMLVGAKAGWRALDPGPGATRRNSACAVASSAFAADWRLSGFPEHSLRPGFVGVSAVAFAGPPVVGGYTLTTTQASVRAVLPGLRAGTAQPRAARWPVMRPGNLTADHRTRERIELPCDVHTAGRTPVSGGRASRGRSDSPARLLGRATGDRLFVDLSEPAPAPPTTSADALGALRWATYDFIDLGCSKGGSLAMCSKRFHAKRGIGIDLDPRKVEAARASGAEAFLADATQLHVHKQVRFVSMLDFLEHLPSLAVVEAILAQAAEAATDFLFIRHPSFEGEGFIEPLGLRQYWWDWHGHTCHFRVSDYCRIFDRLGLRQYRIHFRDEVTSSSHRSILPIGAARDCGPYDEVIHGAKPAVGFAHPLWRSQSIFVALREMGDAEWASISDAP